MKVDEGLDPRAVELAENLLRPTIAEHEEALGIQLRRILEGMAVRGATQSSMHRQAIQKAFEDEVVGRAQLVFNQLFRAINAIGLRDSGATAQNVKAAFQRLNWECSSHLQQACDARIVQAAGRSDDRQVVLAAIDHADKKFGAEIDLALLATARDQSDTSQHYHFHSQVGAVLTGANSAATVHQQIGSDDLRALAIALNGLRADLDRIQPGGPDVDEIRPLIEDAAAEATTGKPNLLKLRALSVAVATTIQTVGALQPAYQSLKAALLPLGVTLP